MTYHTLTTLLESHPESELATLIREKCQPWIAQVKGHTDGKYMLYRGTRNGPDSWGVIPVRTDRKPKDSAPEYHALLDQMFAELGFKARRSNSVFTTSGTYMGTGNVAADAYGIIYIVIPIGEFAFTWSDEYNDAYASAGDMMKAVPFLKEFYENSFGAASAVRRLGQRLPKQSWFQAMMEKYGHQVKLASEEDVAHLVNDDDLLQGDDVTWTWRWLAALPPEIFNHGRAEQMLPALLQVQDPIIAAAMDQWKMNIEKHYHDTDYIAAVQSTNEVMIACKEVLLIKRHDFLQNENGVADAIWSALGINQ